MGLGEEMLRPTSMKWEGFTTHKVQTNGIMVLNVTLGVGSLSRTEEVKFYVVDVQSVYNAIMGTPAQAAFDMVISVPHQRVKFPTHKEIGVELSNPKGMLDYLVKNKKVSIGVEDISSPVATVCKRGKSSTLTKVPKEKSDHPQLQEYEEIMVNPLYPEQTVKIGRSLSTEEAKQLREFLIQHKDNFTWYT